MGRGFHFAPDEPMRVRGDKYIESTRGQQTHGRAHSEWRVAAIRYLQRRLGINVGRSDPYPPTIGCGNFACTYALPDFPGWVIKVTDDESSVAAHTIATAAGIHGVAATPAVAAFPHELPGYWGGDDPPVRPPHTLFVIVQERLFPLPEPEEAWLERFGMMTARKVSQGRPISTDIPGDARPLFEGLATTLRALHDVSLDTWDIKPGNVLADAQGAWKIVDLGAMETAEVEIPELPDELDLPGLLNRLSSREPSAEPLRHASTSARARHSRSSRISPRGARLSRDF